MPANSTAVANEALQLIGTRTNISSLSENSNEAQAMNLIYSDVLDWCLAMANWNFARTTVALTVTKVLNPPPPVPWSGAVPPPPWDAEYLLPADFIRARYVTTTTANQGNTLYLGEPQRFAIAVDGVPVLLTNQANAILIYTARITTTTLWPGYFSRFMTAALAWFGSFQLSGERGVQQYLDGLTTRLFMIAEQINREEGLVYEDTTPEWIQALGINYPNRQPDERKQQLTQSMQPRQQ